MLDLAFVDETVARLGRDRAAAIPILQAIQGEYRWLPPEALRRVSELTDITPATITGVSTFFSQFRHRPMGEHAIAVCHGTACHVKGSVRIQEALERELGVPEGDDTDPQRLFTVEKVACLGCCTLAPVIQIDGVTCGRLSTLDAGKTIEDFLRRLREGNGTPSGRVVTPEGELGEIRIGLDSCCLAQGCGHVHDAIERVLAETGAPAVVKRVGCVSMCHQTPMVELVLPDGQSKMYAQVSPDDVPDIVLEHFKPRGLLRQVSRRLGRWLDRLASNEAGVPEVDRVLDMRDGAVCEFLGPQKHICIEHFGRIDPADLDEYLRHDEVKYLLCNGDEGDPGAFMDRMILESFPYRVIEGIAIAARAIGAKQAYMYIRAEYPLAVESVNGALAACREHGLLGDLDIAVREGAGAFVCGEETALIASIEGRRGMPRLRPPYPADQGLWDRPTLVNNVQTYSSLPWIFRNGPGAFSDMGTPSSRGTKVFALAGKVLRGGLIEVPMGVTIRQIVDEIGGGVAEGRKLKAVQIGGPSGGCVPARLADTPVDFE
ncbi:MAG: NAD(P)H-dependent oxidoreductase subunit E, partial [Thermoguttaceae bacterium]